MIILKYILQLVLFAILNCAAFANTTQYLDRVAAIVNNEVISECDLNKNIQLFLSQISNKLAVPSESTLKRQVLKQMIIDKIQLQMAKSNGISIDKDSLNKSMIELSVQNNISLLKLRNRMELNGVLYKDFK